MIVVGVVVRILLGGVVHTANVEPILVLSMLAGAILGGAYVIVVPVAIMSLTDLYFWFVPNDGIYSAFAIVGLAAFMYSAYVFIAAVGGFAMRRRLLWRTRTIAIFTAISIPLTIAYDVWTAFGDWLFIQQALGRTLWQVYEAQGLFTLIHVFSSLLFAPILGTAFLAVHLHGVPLPSASAASATDR